MGEGLVGFFKKSKNICPVCQEPVEQDAMSRHCIRHEEPTFFLDGRPGFMWRCTCGETDGVWPLIGQAGVGLCQHFQTHHHIYSLKATASDF
jgi:hypothetical protein